MRRLTTPLLVVALVLAACGGDDESSSSTVPPTAPVVTTAAPAPTTPVATEPVTTEPVTTEPEDTAVPETAPAPLVPTLEISHITPDPSTITVLAGPLTEDRPVQRGDGRQVSQGQTFAVPSDVRLADVTIEVVPEELVDEGTPLVLQVYEVGDPVASLPSVMVTEVVLPTLIPMRAGEPAYLTFAFPPLPLAGGRQHAVVLGLGDGAPATTLFVQHASSDTYADGVPIRFEGSGWTVDRIGPDTAFSVTLVD
ncbi:MAG: hypothetical protein MUE78_11610 [Ilumatobacteraceae bacterium]|jgi:hypothetical protein|nr:hypothetical protein [Ilumatobacteraceae bacterium]